jgi:pSer/pThr/pTyr-binding forkhead associated (FHA) protein
MNFCKMCGTSLAAKSAQQPIASTVMATDPAALGLPAGGMAQVVAQQKKEDASGKVNCPACGKSTPSGFSFCQHCGQRLGVAKPDSAAASQNRPPAAAAAPAPTPSVTPTPPAGIPRADVRPVTASRAAPSEDAMAKTMAPSPEMLAPARSPSTAQPATKPKLEPYKPDTLIDGANGKPAPQEKSFGQLVSVNRDGSDGASASMTGESFDVGRSEGALTFADDPYLAPRHVRFLSMSGKVMVRPLDTVNGVYLRVHGSCDLNPGDQFLVGKELMRYEPLAQEERDQSALVEHGIRLFGSAPRESWGRLRQMTISGTTRDIWHLTRPELVLGREEGDVTFPDDEFMSRRHAAVKKVGPKAKLEDLNSSNGTFVRIKGDRELKPGDVLRVGDQLMRFEA